MHTLISVAALKAGLADLRIFDCRFSLADPAAGRRAYEQGHVPGAVHVDMERDLSAPPVPGVTGRHPLPARADWIRRVLAWGLDPDTSVVLYDDAGGAGAARMWWMLRWIGHDDVRVLDGGWQAWLAAGGESETDIPSPRPAAGDAYSAREALVGMVDAAQVDGHSQLLLDAREPARFRGEVEPIDPVAGHIPGALCSPYSGNLGADGSFRPVGELREKFALAAGATQPVVCYCGSGVTACHNILAMVHAGLPQPLLYAGSWSEWVADPTRPVATGD